MNRKNMNVLRYSDVRRVDIKPDMFALEMSWNQNSNYEPVGIPQSLLIHSKYIFACSFSYEKGVQFLW